jgi:predicted ester cyclase
MPAEHHADFERIWNGVWHQPIETRRVITECFTDDFLMHISSLPAPVTKPDWIGFVAGWQKAFPDGRMDILDLIADRERIWCYWVSRGTHSDIYLGIPATRRKVEYQGVDIYRFAGGKIAEGWAVPDVLSLLRQLGAIPQ